MEADWAAKLSANSKPCNERSRMSWGGGRLATGLPLFLIGAQPVQEAPS